MSKTNFIGIKTATPTHLRPTFGAGLKNGGRSHLLEMGPGTAGPCPMGSTLSSEAHLRPRGSTPSLRAPAAVYDHNKKMSHHQAQSFSIKATVFDAPAMSGQPITATPTLVLRSRRDLHWGISVRPPLGIRSGSSTTAANVKMGLDAAGASKTLRKPDFLQGTSPWPIKKHQKGPHDRLPVWRKGIYCCVIRMTLKKNNVSVNLTNLKGQTIIKYTSGLIQKKKNKSKLRSITK